MTSLVRPKFRICMRVLKNQVARPRARVGDTRWDVQATAEPYPGRHKGDQKVATWWLKTRPLLAWPVLGHAATADVVKPTKRLRRTDALGAFDLNFGAGILDLLGQLLS